MAKQNALLILATMEKWFYFCQTTNLIFNDLTIGKVSPKALKSLLGLGVNFCPNPLCPTLNIDKSTDLFERDLHISSVFSGSEDLIPLANPQIYIRSKCKPCDWYISFALKRRLWTFRKALEPKLCFCPIRHNVIPHPRRTIGFIKKISKTYGGSNIQRYRPGINKAKGIILISNLRPSG